MGPFKGVLGEYLGFRVKGPRTQIIGVLGPKCYNINGIWALKPYYLGPSYSPHISLYIPL